MWLQQQRHGQLGRMSLLIDKLIFNRRHVLHICRRAIDLNRRWINYQFGRKPCDFNCFFFNQAGVKCPILCVEYEASLGNICIQLKRLNEKAQGANVAGHMLKLLTIRRCISTSKTLHGCKRMLNCTHCVVLVENGKRTLNLVQYRPDLGKSRTLGWVIEVLFEHLFDVAQARLHLGRQHRHGLSLLRLPRHVVDPFCLFCGTFAGYDCQQTCGHRVSTRGEIVSQLPDIIECAFNKQQTGRHFQSDTVGRISSRCMTSDAVQLPQQLGQRCRVQLGTCVGQSRHFLLKCVSRGCITGGDSVP